MAGVSLITGAGSGIGRQTAISLGQAGDAVAVADIDEAAARKTADAIVGTGGIAAAYALDVADPAAVADVAGAVVRDLGPVERAVNLAGILGFADVEDITDEDWSGMMAVHAGGTFHVCRAVLPGMVERRRGAIVNTASVFALRGQAGAAHYAAAKAAVIAFSKSVAREKAPFGVRVNVVSPGPVDTPFFGRGMSGDELDTVRRERAKTIPLGAIARTEQVSSVIVFLLGDGAAHMTGQVVSVDGGETMR